MVSTPERSQRSTRPGYSPPLSGSDDMSDDSDLASLPEPSQETTDNNTTANTTTNNNTNNQDEVDQDFILVPRDSSPHTPAVTTPNRATSLSPLPQRDGLESALHPDTQWDVTPPSLRRTFEGGVYSPAMPNSANGLSPMREDAPLSPLQANTQEDVGRTITPPSLRRRQNMLVWDEVELSWVARRRLSFVEEEGEGGEGGEGGEREGDGNWEEELAERGVGEGRRENEDEFLERDGREGDGSDGRGERSHRNDGDRENNVDIAGAGQGVGGGCAC